jgi:hypothetical protein
MLANKNSKPSSARNKKKKKRKMIVPGVDVGSRG